MIEETLLKNGFKPIGAKFEKTDSGEVTIEIYRYNGYRVRLTIQNGTNILNEIVIFDGITIRKNVLDDLDAPEEDEDLVEYIQDVINDLIFEDLMKPIEEINYGDPYLCDQLLKLAEERGELTTDKELAEDQVNKWWSSINTKINYKELALDIGLPIDGGII